MRHPPGKIGDISFISKERENSDIGATQDVNDASKEHDEMKHNSQEFHIVTNKAPNSDFDTYNKFSPTEENHAINVIDAEGNETLVKNKRSDE